MEFQVSEIFPSLIIKKDLDEYITDDVLKTVENVIENMTEEVPLSDAYSSRREMFTLFELPKLKELKEYLLDSILKFTLQQYQLHDLNIREAFVVSIPKNGYYELRKNYHSSFHLLINISNTTEIVLQNPLFFGKTFEYQVGTSNKYNSQYSLISFARNEAMIIPSGIYYGFPKRKEELKFITVVIR